MDYLYENLGEDRFQELCQSLLTREFPNVQCFPIRQPDGGRDAIFYHRKFGSGAGFSVFQVKFVRKPQAQQDPHGWLENIIAGELPKIAKLIPKGAKAYHILTNVQGTAHLDVGSIDRLNALLGTLPIPAQCWWRDDLNQRLDTAFDLKWMYPQMLTGSDMLRLILEENLSSDKERRTNALRAFLQAQYDDDKEVRFKQVELQNDLLALFVDVPVGIKRGFEDNEKFYLHNLTRKRPRHQDDDDTGQAAALLLSSEARPLLKQIVLEGAPGQGKSTIAQYICQVHRILLLADPKEQAALPANHVPTFRCVPIKVDLRDLAAWLNKRDPFSREDSTDVPSHWSKSLESFLAALIRNQSGGSEFTVSDLQFVIQVSSILLVLDGLDEVADLARRKDVINEVSVGVSRLRSNSAQLQVVITSRPTAFGPALGFNEKQFPHLELLSLSQPLITEYAEKWLAARRLKPSEASSVRKILRLKIEQRHLKDLTRNPMQLTILLSLIHTRGSSLPEKRTALYDGYVELFFNRESEKSEIVREHRDLLIDLHRYMAWVLHSEAEANQQRGSVSLERFQKLLKAYLEDEQRDETSVADLFKGMVERIVFLVSRVEGTVEFEVQPLREYFVAKHLYETSPYSPPGRERPGTKPDRFDALAQNPYWLNVTRFFAGCFSKGELPCLMDRIEYLAQRERPNFSNRQRRLASFLLRDWVFSQDQRSMQRAVTLVLDGVGLRNPAARRRRALSPVDDELVLPPGCGRDELVQKCFSTLRSNPPLDLASETAQLIVANSSPDLIDGIWRNEVANADGEQLSQWLLYGLYLGSLSRTPLNTLKEKFSHRSPNNQQLRVVLSAGHFPLIAQSEQYCELLVNDILGDGMNLKSNSDILSRFWQSIQPSRYARAFYNPVPRPLRTILHLEEEAEAVPLPHETSISNLTLEKCSIFLNTVGVEIERNVIEWSNDLEPWRRIVEKARELWGDRPILYSLANLAAAVTSPLDAATEFADLSNAELSLCERVRYARSRAGVTSWWEDQFNTGLGGANRLLVLLTFACWSGPKTLLKLVDVVDHELRKLNENEWNLIARAIQNVVFSRSRRRDKINMADVPSTICERTAFIIGLRARTEDRRQMYLRFLSDYSGGDREITLFCLESAMELVNARPQLWNSIATLLRGHDRSGLVRDPYRFYRGVGSIAQSMPLDVARQMAASPTKFPRAWVYAATERCELDATSTVEAVGVVAIKDKWFDR